MLGDRIHRARVGAGLSLRKLAERSGVSHTAITKYEKGLLTPSSDVLLAIARATGVKVEYFFRPETIELERPEYRKRSRLGKKALARIEVQVLDQLERYIELLALFPHRPIPSFEVPSALPTAATLDHVERIADALRAAGHLGENPIADLIGTLEERGLVVLTTPGDPEGRFDGLAASVNEVPVVVVGEGWPGDRQRFTLAHELGHLVLHGRLAEGIDEEKACNRFAGAFLAPATAVQAELGSRRTRLEPLELQALKHEYGLSMAGWIFRAKDQGIIGDRMAASLHRSFRRRGWHRQEPGSPVPSEAPTHFDRLVLRALAEDLIGEAKAAELLGQTVRSFRAHRRMEPPVAAAHQ